MLDPGEAALGGRANGAMQLTTAAGQPVVIKDGQALPWRPVKLYRRVKALRDRAVARNAGSLGAAGLGGPPAGQEWDTPSTLDQVTVLAEDLSKVYVDAEGNDWTLHDMVTALFIDYQARSKAKAKP